MAMVDKTRIEHREGGIAFELLEYCVSHPLLTSVPALPTVLPEAYNSRTYGFMSWRNLCSQNHPGSTTSGPFPAKMMLQLSNSSSTMSITDVNLDCWVQNQALCQLEMVRIYRFDPAGIFQLGFSTGQSAERSVFFTSLQFHGKGGREFKPTKPPTQIGDENPGRGTVHSRLLVVVYSGESPAGKSLHGDISFGRVTNMENLQ
ncbi:unnamed protein product [Darwinula stevensoni]|uniref:Uncharacterized protein n=1 Tax=Darwinula stevensoni TaxID=69355 RepID=A0A7R8X6C2_9CRUS|nr:unnamed protein product [Darwinula stevensoni]CAG0879314.1 unnamed protein product [Darwinula stevensoni]